jgi:nucleoside-diphosphate-sugar epimerase
MKVLIVGGTGNISSSITEQLLEKGGIEIYHYNRGNRPAPEGVQSIAGNRQNFAEFERQMKSMGYFDCVIDMIGFIPEEAESAVRAFKGNVGHYIYCSTVDVYTKQAEYYPMDENHPRNALPSFPYAYNKVRSEDIIFEAHDQQQFPITIFRPAQTYGGSGFAVPSVGDGVYHMKRLREGRKIIIHGDGTSIWVACHRDDVARAFVNAICNENAFGKAYNVTGEELMTYNKYWRIVAKALGAPEPAIVHIPADLLGRMLPRKAEWCVENFQHNNIFDNTAARTDLGFQYTISWEQGVTDVILRLDEEGRIAICPEHEFYDEVIEQWEQLSAELVQRIIRYDQ